MFNEFRALLYLPADDAESSDEDVMENHLASPDRKRLCRGLDNSKTLTANTPQPRSMPRPKRTPRAKGTPQTSSANGHKTKNK